MKIRQDAGKTLFESRERQGLSRKELELRTQKNGFKVTEATIHNIEHGISKRPWPRNIYALAEALSLDTADLFMDEAEEAVS